MRVFIDCRALYWTGIGRYIRSLIHEGLKLQEDLEYVLAGNPEVLKAFIIKNQYLNRVKIKSFSAPIYGFREQVYGSWLINGKQAIDIVHYPHYNMPWLVPPRSVLTVHDVIPLIFTGDFNRVKVYCGREVMRNALKKAERVIAVSKSTAADLTAMFPNLNLEEKTRIIHQGVADKFYPLGDDEVKHFKKQNKLGKYLLYVGNRFPYKNLRRLLEAFLSLRAEFPELQMVIAGGCQTGKDEVQLFKEKWGLNQVIEMEGLNDSELHLLYCGAEAFVFPSLYEGFGLPPLEAMACGVPVLVSNTSALPEVVGDAGVYFNPYDCQDMAGSLAKVLSDHKLRRQMRERGIKQAAKFSWRETARQTLELYKEIMDENRSG